MSLLKLAILAVVALVLGLFVLRPLLRKPPEGAALPSLLPRSLGRMDGQALGMGDALSGEIDDSDLRPEALRSAERPDQDQIDPVERMRALIAGRQDETLHILRGWMSEQRDGAR